METVNTESLPIPVLRRDGLTCRHDVTCKMGAEAEILR